MINVGIIGAGRIGKVHLESIANNIPNAKVVAVAEPFLNKETEEFLKYYGVEKITKDYKEIISDSNIDAVLICSSTDTHSDISVEAINNNKHVFCEKPIDLDLKKIKNVIDSLNNSKVKYQVGFNRRFDHNFSAIRNAVVNDKIGVPHITKITSRDPEPPNPEYIDLSGGMFLDMTIHDFDMARFLVNAEVETVFVSSAVLIDPEIGKKGDVDTAIITLQMSDGSIAVIDNSRKSAYGYDQRAEVFGTKGMVNTANDTISNAVISDKDGVSGEKPLFFFLERYMGSFTEELRQFFYAIENDTEVPVTADDGLKAVLIGLAAKKSVEEKRVVSVSEIVY